MSFKKLTLFFFKISSIAIIIFFSNFASANTVDSIFNVNSQLPGPLKLLILEHLEKNCSEGIQAFGLRELSTTSESKLTNNTIYSNTIYITQLISIYYADGYHPSKQEIKIQSEEVKNTVNNEAKYNILTLDANCSQF